MPELIPIVSLHPLPGGSGYSLEGESKLSKEHSNQLGEKIRRLRKQMGLTQEELGERANIHYSYVGQVERGDKMPSLKTLKKLAAALNTPVQYLLEEPSTYSTSENILPEVVAEFRQLIAGRSLDEVRFCLGLLREILQFLDMQKELDRSEA